MSWFAFVAAERANHAVATLCRIAGASVSGFYAWLRAIPLTRARADAEAELRGLIGRIFATRRRAYGSRRVHAELRREGRRLRAPPGRPVTMSRPQVRRPCASSPASPATA